MNNIKYLSILLILLLIIPVQSYQVIDKPEIKSYKLDLYQLRESRLIDIIDNINYNPDLTRIIINDRVAVVKSSDIALLRSKDLNIIIDQPLTFNNFTDGSRLQEIHKADLFIANDLNGSNIKIAVVDTGVDFSNLDIRDSLARDKDNKPIMLDADAQGIVLTETKFIAKINDGKIVNNTDIVYDDYTSDVYVNNDGVFLRIVRENNTLFKLYNPLYPILSPLVFNVTTRHDWKIGNSPQDYIRSASGVYRMGFSIEPQFHLGRFGLIILPVLVVDTKEPNVYDTIIVDMSDAWIDFAIFELKRDPNNLRFDYDFTDEEKRVIGDGNELLLYDADNDNLPDLTAGILGSYAVDLWNVFSNTKYDLKTGLPNATILKPIDSKGRYFVIMYDFFGHGTAVSSTITSKGINKYNIYNNGIEYIINGIAPGAKIVPIKALWAGDTQYAWLWAAGFELVNGTWIYNNKKADIINNSWGIPVFTLLEYIPTYDPISVLADILSTPGSLDKNYPGILIVSSAGNSGYAHGTISSPGSSNLSLTVGATTNNIFVGYGFTKNQPRFGNSTIHFNDIAEFSSRGPLANGYSKPEIVATGAYAFVPMLINVKHVESNPIWLFGGTSMAAPIVSGASSLIIQALRDKGIEPTPSLVKTILLSSAKDISNEPFAQGSGVLDLKNALQYINNNSFIVYTNYTYQIPNTKYYDMLKINYTSNQQSSIWYAGFINRNDSKEQRFYIENRDNNLLIVNIKPIKLELIKRIELNGTTTPRVHDPILNTTGGFIPNYIRLNKTEIPNNTELMVIRLRFPFETFMNMSDIYAHNLKISSLYFYEWSDINNDNNITFNELKLVNRGGAYGTIQDLSISKPLQRIKDNMVIGVYPVPNIISFWRGVMDINATAMNYTLTIDLYKKDKWDIISTPDTLFIKPNSTSSFIAKISIPDDYPYGIHQGYLSIMSSKHTVNIPVSFSIPLEVNKKDIPFVIVNNASNTLFYEPSSLNGAFDMSSRFNAGEWKFYHINLIDPRINTLSIKVIWENDLTSISIFAIDPNGKIIATSVPAGVFQKFIGWGSNDWLGSGALGSGAFYPSSNFGNNTSVMYIPINSTGIYTLMLHNTLFNAKNLTEPFRLELKASTILADTEAPSIEFNIPRYIRGSISIPVNIYDKNLENVIYVIDGKEHILYDNIIIESNMSDGLHTLQVYAKDSVGNIVNKSTSFIIDNTQPEIIFDIPNRIFSGIIEMNLKAIDDNLANISIKLPDGNVVNNTRFVIDTKVINDGKYKIIINATDLAGNNSTLVKEIEIDNTPPLIDIDASKSDKIIGGIDILYNVTDPNLDTITLLIDDLSIKLDNTGIYKLDTSSLNDGEHEISIIAKDLAGNEMSKSIKINTINKQVLIDNSRNYGLIIGIIIGGLIITAILVPLYIRKGRFINY